ncbi:hypothetical protein [Stigmatella aurantiaca]|uniref:Secreted protein n=1 Tax=Stigmatella aurantiaca (strain DW4/3-1) TaxID=378806 RepID=Q090V2_STIAD|nr:hypothetical protein [Stigmatella aurantiaca]ADO75685.1 uncharacterized protein STAUR_7930 [Stigmatella aurantiaca DW4/3-1]EAU66239.1 hypothetical protein STIAU_3829 [Stigmatella aurantiaca DW4/3-1]
MARNTWMGFVSALSLVTAAVAPAAHALPLCAEYCGYGVCGRCDEGDGFITTCRIYNGCGGKYPIPFRASSSPSLMTRLLEQHFQPQADCATPALALPAFPGSQYLPAAR